MTQLSSWIDITMPLRPDLPAWPGETRPRIWRSKQIPTHGVNVTELVLGAHTGTHVDAPRHFVEGGGGVESMDLSTLIGICQVVTIESVPEIGADALEAAPIREGCERLLLRTANRHHWGPGATDFKDDFVALSADGADWIVANGIRLLGIDYLSVQPYHHPTPTVHLTLLMAGVAIVEGLLLGDVADGEFDLVCLPLLVPGADGAPARTLIRPR